MQLIDAGFVRRRRIVCISTGILIGMAICLTLNKVITGT